MPGVYYRDALLIAVAGVVALIGSKPRSRGFRRIIRCRIAAARGVQRRSRCRIPAVSSIGFRDSHALMFSAILAAIAGSLPRA